MAFHGAVVRAEVVGSIPAVVLYARVTSMERYLFRKEGSVGSIPSTGSGVMRVMRRTAFTLIELLIVFVVLGIVSSLLYGAVKNKRYSEHMSLSSSGKET